MLLRKAATLQSLTPCLPVGLLRQLLKLMLQPPCLPRLLLLLTNRCL